MMQGRVCHDWYCAEAEPDQRRLPHRMDPMLWVSLPSVPRCSKLRSLFSIQLGYGPPSVQVTPQAGMPSTSYDNTSMPYGAQYRSLDDGDEDLDQAYLPSNQPSATYRMSRTLDKVPTISDDAEAVEWQSLRYKKGPVPKLLRLKPPTPMTLHTTMLGSGLVSI